MAVSGGDGGSGERVMGEEPISRDDLVYSEQTSCMALFHC